MGTYEAPKIEPQVAKDIMDVMVATYIKKRKPAEGQIGSEDYQQPSNFPYELNVEMKSALIKEYGLDPKDVKKVLNGIIEVRQKEIEEERKKRGNLNPDPVEYKASEKDLFDETVSLLRLALEVEVGKNVTVSEEVDKD
ncbi:8067_t:CDS:1, partial [Cetraspora pellucida]